VGPETATLLIDAARVAAIEVAAKIDALERMAPSDLIAHADELETLHLALVERFTLVPPPGMPHEPAVLAWTEWRATSLRHFMEDWRKVIDGMPNNSFARFCTVYGRMGEQLAAHLFLSRSSERAAKERWSRLDPVKEWALEQRRADSKASRAAVIRRIAPQVREMAKNAGEPLSGDDQAVIETVTRWFRKAKIQ
jgi:hypothetical protein